MLGFYCGWNISDDTQSKTRFVTGDEMENSIMIKQPVMSPNRGSKN